MTTNALINWQPVPYVTVKDQSLSAQIYETGYAVLDNFLEDSQVESLKELYKSLHNLKSPGLFWGLYSQDIAYRKKTHEEIGKVVEPSVNRHFTNHKVVLNSFVIKSPGEGSEFVIHQDTTATDELKYSPLSIWFALDDVNIEDGAMCFVPKSHRWFSPYRGISFPFPFSGFMPLVNRYLVPVTLKKGQALLFDPRIVHHSLSNTTGKDRVAMVTGIFPKEANFQICYKDPSVPDSPVEIYEQPDDYLLTYLNFYHDCMARPTVGVKTRHAEPELVLNQITPQQWENVCKANGIEPLDLVNEEVSMNFKLISEPK